MARQKRQLTSEQLLEILDQARINLENAERTNQTLADQLTGAVAHNRALSAGLEAALRHFRLARLPTTRRTAGRPTTAC